MARGRLAALLALAGGVVALGGTVYMVPFTASVVLVLDVEENTTAVALDVERSRRLGLTPQWRRAY